MKIALYAGSFDPITNGHIDILKTSATIFDKTIVAIANNINKQYFLPLSERLILLKEAVKEIPNVEVDYYEGLTIEYAKQKNANILVRGVRNSIDYEYESQLAQTNNSLSSDIKTVLLLPNIENNFVSSSMVKEIFINGGDISKYVPEVVQDFLTTYYDT